MSWIVRYYSKETNRFIERLGPIDRAAVIQELEDLERFGFSKLNESLKKIADTKNIWEIKVKRYRIFIVPLADNIIQILFIIIKKSNKTPKETIELIRQRAKLFGEK